jgi:hypothetical protein
MLASITPLGERGRHGHWAITVSAFLFGALVAGALVGLALGLAGSALVSGVALGTRLAVLTAALLAAAALDAGPWAVPGPHRQVDERWLDRYRGWVYGLGYGSQLGAGVATGVTSAATYTALLAAFLSADRWRGAVIFGIYGAIRGLTPLLAARVRRPDDLVAFHARLHRARGGAARAGTALLGVAFVLAAASAAAL